MVDRAKLKKFKKDKIMDFDASLKLFNKERDVFEMWEMLAKDLIKAKSEIMLSYKQYDKEGLSFQLCKLIEALAYVSAPRIEFESKRLNLSLESDGSNTSEYYSLLINEIDTFIEAYADVFAKKKQVGS